MFVARNVSSGMPMGARIDSYFVALMCLAKLLQFGFLAVDAVRSKPTMLALGFAWCLSILVRPTNLKEVPSCQGTVLRSLRDSRAENFPDSTSDKICFQLGSSSHANNLKPAGC